MNDWKAFPGPQFEFCQRPEFEVLYGGAAGGGKSSCLISLAVRHIDKSGYRGLLLRRTFPRLSEIIDRTHELYPAHGGVWRATEKLWQFPSGAKIKLGQMQHEESKRDYWGHEYQFIGYDELTEFTETQYAYMKARCRTTDPSIPTRIRATTNPGGPGHLWVKEHFVDVATAGVPHVDPKTGLSRCFIKGTVYDNPALMENNPEYIQILESLPHVERLRFLHGDWDVFAGQVFSTLSQRVHGCEPYDIPKDWFRFVVVDWGFAKPFCVLWISVDFDNILHVYREWYGCKEGHVDVGLRMVAGEVAQGILDREDPDEKIRVRIGDKSMFNPVEQKRRGELVGPTFAHDFAGQGCPLLKSDSDRGQGIGQVHKRFALELDVDEKTGEVLNEYPRVQIFNTCKHFWRTVPSLQADKRNVEDVDTRQEDHAYDAFRYACMFRPIKPTRVKMGPPRGSFQFERAKLARARKYARQHGISLDIAYVKIR